SSPALRQKLVTAIEHRGDDLALERRIADDRRRAYIELDPEEVAGDDLPSGPSACDLGVLFVEFYTERRNMARDGLQEVPGSAGRLENQITAIEIGEVTLDECFCDPHGSRVLTESGVRYLHGLVTGDLVREKGKLAHDRHRTRTAPVHEASYPVICRPYP